ncbi:MAG TPA: colicin transporter [Sphingobium sp.]|uniref:colicin transporter n=1 Tax=Sphingobium sp. TaxID=1912891 RepID=UPI002ED64BE7
MIAIKRLKNILWILIVAFGALTAYLISLRVATERNQVVVLERNIYHVRGDIRYLETEFESRANMRQLEKWNNDDYRYGAPQAAQYLPDERALASLQGVKSNGDVYVAPPVMMAMADAAASQPKEKTATESPAASQIRADDSILRVAAASTTATAPVKEIVPLVSKASHKADSEARAVPVRTAQVASPSSSSRTPDPVARKTARMALLDSQLLDDRTLRDLGAKAQAENRTRGN